MKKTFMGVRLRRLREERSMSQIALAQSLGISPSYLNQLEQNQRPLTVSVLLKINRALGLDVQMFSEDEEARLITDLREAFTQAAAPDTVSLAEIKELASGMPAVARTMIRMHQRHRDALEQLESMAALLGDDRSGISGVNPLPYEEVRDFFTARNNYIAELDTAAEQMALDCKLGPAPRARGWRSACKSGTACAWSKAACRLSRGRIVCTTMHHAHCSCRRRWSRARRPFRWQRKLRFWRWTRYCRAWRSKEGSAATQCARWPALVWPTILLARCCCPMALSCTWQRDCVTTSTIWAGALAWDLRRCATA